MHKLWRQIGEPPWYLPENLLNEAMKVTHTNTKTAVIVKALEELVRKSKISDLKKYRGKIELNIDLNEIRDRHNGRIS